jgi:hypothetical protein
VRLVTPTIFHSENFPKFPSWAVGHVLEFLWNFMINNDYIILPFIICFNTRLNCQKRRPVTVILQPAIFAFQCWLLFMRPESRLEIRILLPPQCLHCSRNLNVIPNYWPELVFEIKKKKGVWKSYCYRGTCMFCGLNPWSVIILRSFVLIVKYMFRQFICLLLWSL